MRLPREALIPPGAVKVAAKHSSAVAYLYGTAARPCALVFHGRGAKPVGRWHYRSAAGREQHVAGLFRTYAEREARKVADRAAARAFAHACRVGDLFVTCWGYEQTNREFFEVVALRGKLVVLREIAQVRHEDHRFRGICAPQVGQYVGPEIARRPGPYGIRIDSVRHASPLPMREVAGVRVADPVAFTAYA